jgi:hypothetical protein
MHIVEGGDHSFSIGGKDPQKQAAVYHEVQQTIVDWIETSG